MKELTDRFAAKESETTRDLKDSLKGLNETKETKETKDLRSQKENKELCCEHKKYGDIPPYEKFVAYGAQACTDAELIAIVLRTGTSRYSTVDIAVSILDGPLTLKKGLQALNHLSLKELQQYEGIGEVKAVKLKCIAEISKRMAMQSREESLSFTNPKSIADYFMESLRHLETEETFLISIDSKSAMIDCCRMSSGTVNATIISPREIFIHALSVNAVSIILMHNHPSGIPEPSNADYELTRAVKKSGELVGIPLADHIIIGDLRFFSFREEGSLWA